MWPVCAFDAAGLNASKKETETTMMGKTHISVGIAAALIASQATGADGVAIAVAGGAAGGILPDFDLQSSPKLREPPHTQVIVLALVVASLIVDVVNRGPMMTAVLGSSQSSLVTGAALFIGALFFGMRTAHRTFTHSILGTLVMGAAVSLICPPLTVAFVAGFVSHIALDLLNKKSIQLFYPLKAGKFALRWFYADGIANRVLFFVGIAAIAFWLGKLVLGY